MQKKPRILRRLAKRALVSANVVVVAWLLLCLAASYTSPREVKYLALCSLTIPFALLFNAGFAVFWLFTTRRLFSLFSIGALLACYQLVLVVFGWNLVGRNDWKPAEDRVKVMSWNVHGLGLFNKPLNKEDKKNIARVIKDEDADILCLPEYSLMRDGSTEKYTLQLAKENGYKAYKFNTDNTYGYHVILGTQLFSRYPLSNYTSYDLGNMIYLVQADVQLPRNKTMRMFFIHLYSFGLSDNDRNYIEQVRNNNTEIKSDLGVSRTFIGKFNRSWAIRAGQADSIAAIVSKSPYPVLLCGDFNDLPGSYTYTKIRGNLNDAFCDKGVGIGRTYNQIFPTLRIDNILYDSRALEALAYRSYYTHMSDHNPVIANFRILEPVEQE